jgi:hypothetical protein
MIRTASDMLAALKSNRFCGVVLYRGPSMIDGAPIVAIANKITSASTNVKTGAMVQTFIIRSDVSPVVALKSGLDSSVCGDCLMRPYLGGACYVNVGRSVRSVYETLIRGDRYAEPGVDYDVAILPELFAGLGFRLGTYGDPAAVPFQVWRAATLRAAFTNGYSHQWRDARFQALKTICMASCDSLADLADATAAGWRSFRVRTPSEAKAKGEVICPASKEAGVKTSCDACQSCGGTSAKAKASMVIIAHGATAKRFVGAQA